MELDTTGDATSRHEDDPTPGSAGAGELPRGTLVGRYLLLGRLGAGGMGVVYAAHDPDLDRKVALKLVLPAAGGGTGAAHARLLREAQALARLSHPNVVAIHDVGIHGEQVWLAMELVAGQTLGAWAKARRRGWPEILRVLTDVARGVAAAHAAGLVHRDLKPDNVMIGRDGRVRVMDFGLAHGRTPRAVEPDLTARTTPELAMERAGALAVTIEAESGSQPEHAALGLRLTREGAIQGTPAYMAPEQWQGREAEAATDQFGWSVLAWELLHGERPFAGATVAAVAANVQAGRRRPAPRGRGVPGWLRRAIERGLAMEPGRRWPTMAALVAELERGRTRARVRTAAVTVAGVAALIAGAEGYRQWDVAARVSRCEATGAILDGAWHEAGRQRLREAFTAAGVSHAGATADRVVPRLDRQAGAWKLARTEACLNGEVRGLWSEDILSRAVACLEDRQLEFESLVAEFGRADPTAVQKAVAAVASLRTPRMCVDEDFLRRQPAPPRHAREIVRTARAELSRAVSLGLAGNFEAALATATRVREGDEARGWPPLWAAARAKEGYFLERTGAYEQAESASAEAYFAAAGADAWATAAEAATDLIHTAGYLRARYADAHAGARHANMAIAHAGDPEGLWEAKRLSHLALVHQAEGAYAEARTLHERALAILEAGLGPEHPDVAASLNKLAIVHRAAGAYVEARALHERALAIRERTMGAEHPDVATSLGNLANVFWSTGDYAQARALQERALAIKERAYGPDHPYVAENLNNIAVLCRATGALAEAQALYERALEIQVKVLGPEHPDVAMSLNNLANVHLDLGAKGPAREAYERALILAERALGADHPDVAMGLSNLASLDLAEGRRQEALPRFERALKIREQALGPDHADVAMSLHNLAVLHLAEGQPGEARPLLERALRIREQAQGRDHADVAAVLTNLGDLHLGEGRPREALPLLERAVAIFAAHDGAQDEEFEAHFNLARALAATGGDRARVLAEANRARDGFRAAGPGKSRALAELERWIGAETRGRSRARR